MGEGQNSPMNDSLKQPLFSSTRERRLWVWVLAVVVAIYSTLGLAAKLVRLVPDERLIGNLMVFCFFLFLVTILTQGLKRRPGGLEIGVALGIAVVYALVVLRMATPMEHRTHLIEYGILGMLIHEALLERRNQGRRVPVPAVIAVLAASMIGVIDECIQAFLPSRVFDPIDMGFNAGAATMAVAASSALAWARRRAVKWIDGKRARSR